jgi:hypothetical protein
VDFARGALALPSDDAGRKMRDSVPDIIMLQAVWFALGHLEELAPDEQALGLDRAEVLIDKHAGALARRWGRGELPVPIGALVDDARRALSHAQRRKNTYHKGTKARRHEEVEI